MRKPARDVGLVGAVVLAEAAFETGLLVQREEDVVGREEGREPDQQRQRAEQRRLARQHRQHGRDHQPLIWERATG